ncbi:MAG: aminoglycoside phosphotransferase family protein, partial [candidate division FCPU426 bacterium]
MQELDQALIGRLLAAQFPTWAGLAMELFLPSGTDNQLYRLGNDKVLRFPRSTGTNQTLKKEREWLPRLAPQLPLAIPIPLASGAPGEGYLFEWAVYSWLPGENLVDTPVRDKNQLALDMAQFITALQRISPQGGPLPAEHNFFRGVPLQQRDAATRKAIEALGPQIDVNAVNALWEAALLAPRWSGPPVWIHGDLDARNLLAQNGRLSAVIDFGGLGVGDPACDMMVAWKILPADARQIFKKALAVDEATWVRAQGWVLSQALMILSYYTMETNALLV